MVQLTHVFDRWLVVEYPAWKDSKKISQPYWQCSTNLRFLKTLLRFLGWRSCFLVDFSFCLTDLVFVALPWDLACLVACISGTTLIIDLFGVPGEVGVGPVREARTVTWGKGECKHFNNNMWFHIEEGLLLQVIWSSAQVKPWFQVEDHPGQPVSWRSYESATCDLPSPCG